MESKLEPLDCDCEDCGAVIVVDSFWDGDEYYCPECGWRHMWSVFDEDDATLVMLEDVTPGQTIANLLARLKATEQQLNAVANEWDNERKNYQEASARLKEAQADAVSTARHTVACSGELAEIAQQYGFEFPKAEEYERIATAIIDKYKTLT